MDMYSDENGVQFAQSMIYNYQQELWENNWGHCPEMDACQTEIRHSDEMTHLEQKLSELGYRFMITKNGKSIYSNLSETDLETARSVAGEAIDYTKMLFDREWGMDSLGDAATVTVHINRLRDKLGKNESKNQFIETVWGAG